jgi:hypothetical protein
MKKQDYQCSFIVPVSPDDLLDGIADVSAWWAKNFVRS